MARPNRKTITRDRIMHAAVAQFSEKGYDAASIQSIVEEANVAHGTIFWHFGNKEKLYTEVARWAGNQFFEALSAEVRRPGKPPTIAEMAKHQYDYFRENPQIGALSLSILFEASGPHPELAPALRLFNRRQTDLWRQWAQRCADDGILRPDCEPEVVGMLVATMLAGVHLGCGIHKWERAERYFDTVTRIFDSGCFVAPPAAIAAPPANQDLPERRVLRPIPGGRAN